MRTFLILGPPAVLCIYFILRLSPLRVEHPNQADAEGRTFVRPFGFITWMEFMDPSSYDARGKKLLPWLYASSALFAIAVVIWVILEATS